MTCFTAPRPLSDATLRHRVIANDVVPEDVPCPHTLYLASETDIFGGGQGR